MKFSAPRTEYYKRRGQLLEVTTHPTCRSVGLQDAWLYEKGKTATHCGVGDEYLKLFTLITRDEAVKVANKLGHQLFLQVTDDAGLARETNKHALWQHCQQFIKEQKISCAETIGQCDRVIVNAYDFIEGVCEIVGYEKDGDE